MGLRRVILSWYGRHKRDLAWRRTRDPYAIWVSEIMLQQTRVETVVPHYERFLRRFPSVGTLARATEPSVLAAWSGLGYYRRARNLHAAARRVVREHGGAVPRTREELLALPGIGEYTAAAISSIAFGAAEAAVDGNVLRVLSRIAGWRGRRDSAALRRRVEGMARDLARGPRPGDWTQALMELGATICFPREPLCERCPAGRVCVARTHGDPSRYPEPLPMKRPRRENRLILLARAGRRVLLVPEGASWSLPFATITGSRSSSRVARDLVSKHIPGTRPEARHSLTFQHRTYSHDLSYEVWQLETRAKATSAHSDLRWATFAQLEKLPLRSPTLKALKHIRR